MLADPEKLEAALEQFEAEKERRIQARVEAGKAVRVPLYVVVGPDEPDAAIEIARAQKLADLREAGEKREVVFDELVIRTGVPRSSSYGKEEASAASPELTVQTGEPLPEPIKPPQIKPPDIVEPRRVWTQVRPPSDDDPGAIAEGKYTIERGAIHVSDMYGRPLASQTLGAGDDPEAVARRLLQEKRQSFWDPLPLPRLRVV